MLVEGMPASMGQNPAPIRAKENDVYDAVYQDALSIVLMGKAVHGKYPVEAVMYFSNIA